MQGAQNQAATGHVDVDTNGVAKRGMAAPPKPRSLQAVLQEATPDRKLLIVGPGNEKLQDSRFAIADIGDDYIAIRLLGDELMVIPFSSLVHVRAERTQVTLRLR